MQRMRFESCFQFSLELRRYGAADLILNRDMRAPAPRVLCRLETAKSVGELLPHFL